MSSRKSFSTAPLLFPFVVLATVAAAKPVSAQETCGNVTDDDADGRADEGCHARVCESPYTCGQVGSVAPKSGALTFGRPPDLAPLVPYGPPLAFGRVYLSQYDPGYLPGGGQRPRG